MTDRQRQAIRDLAHLLRSRVTYLLLCSHALKLDLADLQYAFGERLYEICKAAA